MLGLAIGILLPIKESLRAKAPVILGRLRSRSARALDHEAAESIEAVYLFSLLGLTLTLLFYRLSAG